MKRDALRIALRSSLRLAGPRHYAQVDMALATKLGGAMWLIACAYTLVLLPLAPPRHGPIGWIVELGGIGLAIVGGLSLLRRKRTASPLELLAGAYIAVFGAAALAFLVGPGSPAPQLLLLAMMYTAAIHPARHILAVYLLSTIAYFSPLYYGAVDSGFIARTASQVLLAWALGAVLLAWTAGVRRQRLEAREAQEEAEGLARVDSLTGLGNKRALDEELSRAVAGARRLREPLGLLVCDMDAFKAVNDRFGHPAGDALLKDVAEAIQSVLRGEDPCFRWGGDEFVAILHQADLEAARLVADRVTAGVAQACTTPDGHAASISVGCASLGPTEDAVDLVTRADADLREVKQSGARPVMGSDLTMQHLG